MQFFIQVILVSSRYYITPLPFNYWLHRAKSLWLRMYLQSILFICILAYNFRKWCTDTEKLFQGLSVTKLTKQNIVILCNKGRDSSLSYRLDHRSLTPSRGVFHYHVPQQFCGPLASYPMSTDDSSPVCEAAWSWRCTCTPRMFSRHGV